MKNEQEYLKPILIIGFLFTTFFITAVSSVNAHQPNYIGTQNSITIIDPEISKAYYGELKNAPAVYTINSSKGFELYLNILAPDVASISKDFSVVVEDEKGNFITKLDGEHFTWERWYEDFAGDWYWKGPEFKQTEPAGNYTITVSNPTNTGKYVLAPGEKEVFTLGGTPRTIQQIYLTKTKFFGKSSFDIYQGKIGHILLGITAVGILLCVFGIRKYIKGKKS